MMVNLESSANVLVGASQCYIDHKFSQNATKEHCGF